MACINLESASFYTENLYQHNVTNSEIGFLVNFAYIITFNAKKAVRLFEEDLSFMICL